MLNFIFGNVYFKKRFNSNKIKVFAKFLKSLMDLFESFNYQKINLLRGLVVQIDKYANYITCFIRIVRIILGFVILNHYFFIVLYGNFLIGLKI